jgi:hypothetical protein
MTDKLDKQTDAQLSEVFATEVAGWTKSVHEGCDVIPYGYVDWEDAEGKTHDKCPAFATDANAVLPWTKNYGIMCDCLIHNHERKGWFWDVIVIRQKSRKERLPLLNLEHRGIAKTFPRAMCIALIRAKRKEPK